MKGPNIFDYATSELSQDAFICYLLEFGKEQYKNDFSKEYEIAHHFLEKCGIPFDEKIEEIKKQYNCIDVLVVMSSYLLVIEDKVGTNEHDDQIVRYVKELKDSGLYSDKKIKVCYLKTMDYVRNYESSNKDVLPQSDCCSLRREDILNLLEENRSCNFIFDSFYCRLSGIEDRIKECDDDNIKSWIREKWFDYLSSVLIGHNFNIVWVNNARGGFYACYFDWFDCGDGEKYKQIEISFEDGKTADVKLCFKFATESKVETRKNKPLIEILQNNVDDSKYTFANRIGRTTTYAFKCAEDKQDIQNFIDAVF